jgi:hypothetical protein
MFAQTFSPRYPLHAALHGAPNTQMIAEKRPRKQGDLSGLSDSRSGYPRCMRILRKLAVLGLLAVSGYAAWRLYSGRTRPADPRISTRAGLTASEAAVGSDDPVAQATAILADSDDRSLVTRDEPGVERRRSEDTVEH